MERLTIPDVRIDQNTIRRSIIDAEKVKECAMEIYWRLKSIEDAVADAESEEYDLDRLRELLNADRDGRCFIAPFVAMVEQSLTGGEMKPQRDQRFNGRYAVVYFDKEKWAFPLIDICWKHYDRKEAEERMKALTREAAETALKGEQDG